MQRARAVTVTEALIREMIADVRAEQPRPTEENLEAFDREMQRLSDGLPPLSEDEAMELALEVVAEVRAERRRLRLPEA
jgi:hypothetical protein